jgi:hypothetical protein
LGVRPGAYPIGAPERCFSWVGSDLTHKYWNNIQSKIINEFN